MTRYLVYSVGANDYTVVTCKPENLFTTIAQEYDSDRFEVWDLRELKSKIVKRFDKWVICDE